MEKNNLVLKNFFAENGLIQIFYDIKDAKRRKVKGEHAQWEKEEPFKVNTWTGKTYVQQFKPEGNVMGFLLLFFC